MTGKILTAINFQKDFNITNWDENLQLNKNSVNVSFNNYLDIINTLITEHVPIKKIIKNSGNFFRNHG